MRRRLSAAAAAAARPLAATVFVLSVALLALLAGPRGALARKPRRRQAAATPHSQLALESAARARSASGDSVRRLLDESMQHVLAGLSESDNDDFVLLNLAVTNLHWKGWRPEDPKRGLKARAQFCDRARAVFQPADKGRVTLQDMRYFFTICCDDARRQGDAAARAGCFLEAGRAGVWQHEWQYPQIVHDGLSARPWWTEEQLQPKTLSALRSLQDQWQTIRREALASSSVGAFSVEPDALFETGQWDELVLELEGKASTAGCAAMPETCALLHNVLSREGLAEAMAGVTKGAVKVSRLSPGTTIKPHCAAENDRVRVHLALSVPDGDDIGIRVADETRGWEEGQLLVFDDSFEHEVWHRGTEAGSADRLVLIIDLRHPDLEHKKAH